MLDTLWKIFERFEKPIETFLFVVFGLCLIALLLFAVAARADDNVAWDFPTSRVDGTPLLLSEIATTRVRSRDVATGAVEVMPVPSPTNSIFVERDPTAAGVRCYMAQIVDTVGRASEWSPEVCKEIEGVFIIALPRPPGALRVT